MLRMLKLAVQVSELLLNSLMSFNVFNKKYVKQIHEHLKGASLYGGMAMATYASRLMGRTRSIEPLMSFTRNL